MDFYQIISLIPNSITFIFDRHRQYKVSGQKKRQSHYFNDHKNLENLWKYVIIGRKISGNLVLLIWEWDKGIFVKIRFRDCCVDVSSGRVGPPWPWCQIQVPGSHPWPGAHKGSLIRENSVSYLIHDFKSYPTFLIEISFIYWFSKVDMDLSDLNASITLPAPFQYNFSRNPNCSHK